MNAGVVRTSELKIPCFGSPLSDMILLSGFQWPRVQTTNAELHVCRSSDAIGGGGGEE